MNKYLRKGNKNKKFCICFILIKIKIKKKKQNILFLTFINFQYLKI